MGVPGLTTFIDCNPQLLKDHKLHGGRIVIDGNNLYHFLYYYFGVTYEYGGDYNNYRMFVKFFFNTLAECGVEPLVVFDGGHSEGDRKLRTSIRRAKERTHLCGFLSHGSRGKVLPILTYETFRYTLDELSVHHVTCDFEADEQIAALANYFGCPVLTNDSDFFIYDVRAGTVLLDYLNLKQHVDEENGTKYICVQRYKLNNLLKKFSNLDAKGVALFATLMGNDLVDGKTFQAFFSNVRLPRANESKLKSPRKQTRMLSILQWIDSFTSLEAVITSILKTTKQEGREHLRGVILKSIESYTKLSPHLSLISKDPSSLGESALRSYSGRPLPTWFMQQIHSGRIPVFMVNILTLRRVILLSQIEVMTNPSAYNTSMDIRQIIYGILLSVEGEEDLQEAKVVEFNREGKAMKKFEVLPTFTLPNSSTPLPTLKELEDLNYSAKLDIFFSSIGISKELTSKLSENYLLFVAAAVTWIRNSIPKISIVYLKSLIVTSFKLHVLDRLIQDGEPQEEDIFLAFFKGNSSDESLQEAHGRLDKFTAPAKHTRLIQFNGEYLHALSQFQACLLHTSYLAQLLLLPLPSSKPEYFINGTFFYAMCRELSSRKDPQLYIEELLGRDSFLATEFNSFLDCVLGHIDLCDIIGYDTNCAKKNTKKKKKKGAKAVARIDTPSTDEDGEENVDSTKDLNNRFACLDLEL